MAVVVVPLLACACGSVFTASGSPDTASGLTISGARAGSIATSPPGQCRVLHGVDSAHRETASAVQLRPTTRAAVGTVLIWLYPYVGRSQYPLSSTVSTDASWARLYEGEDVGWSSTSGSVTVTSDLSDQLGGALSAPQMRAEDGGGAVTALGSWKCAVVYEGPAPTPPMAWIQRPPPSP